jgi:hypothetical protein
MCDVCCADQALTETKSTRRGYAVFDWDETDTRVDVRAEGKGPEFKPCRYQVRRPGEPWPAEWTETKDLAGSMMHWGFDVKWQYVPLAVRNYLMGRGRKPDVEVRA